MLCNSAKLSRKLQFELLRELKEVKSWIGKDVQDTAAQLRRARSHATGKNVALQAQTDIVDHSHITGAHARAASTKNLTCRKQTRHDEESPRSRTHGTGTLSKTTRFTAWIRKNRRMDAPGETLKHDAPDQPHPNRNTYKTETRTTGGRVPQGVPSLHTSAP